MAKSKSHKQSKAQKLHAVEERKKNTTAFLLVIAAVCFAGIASLLYEVLWVRQLGLSLGSTAVATSVMLTAFLGGLAIGSVLIGRMIEKLKSHENTFMGVEFLAAIFGLLSIPALELTGRAYVFISATFHIAGFGATLLRIVFSLFVMLIPAILFGCTFPLTTEIAAKFRASEEAAGTVSAVSSFGSCIGALLCGLWLEPTFGLFASAMIGSAFNLAALGCIALVKKTTAEKH